MNKNICVIGAGYWGNNHIRTLSKLNSLSGVVEVDDKKLKSRLNKYPNVQGYKNIEDALLEDYDGFIIATPAKLILKLQKKSLNLGRNSLIEKPLTLSIEEAEELVYLTEENNVNVMVGHVLLFHPAIIKIKKMIENGDIGNLQYIYSNRLNLGKVRTEENVFWSLAPHDLAIFQYFTNSMPINIQAKGSTFLQKGIPDSTLTQLEYKNGVKGHIFVSWLHPFKEHRLVVIGSEAMISFEDSLDDKPLKFYSKKFDINYGVPEKVDGPVELIPYEKRKPLEIELEYFLNFLMKKKPKISNIHNGLQVVRVLVEASQQILK